MFNVDEIDYRLPSGGWQRTRNFFSGQFLHEKNMFLLIVAQCQIIKRDLNLQEHGK